MRSVNTYHLPVNRRLITETVIDSESHTGPYKGSVDFAIPLGTEVLAALDGKVTRVRDDSDKYSEDPASGPDVNYITLEHNNGELSEYLHLAKGSAVVNVGQTVRTGHILAKTGLSGWLYSPHLHFMVYKKDATNEDFQCLDVRFD